MAKFEGNFLLLRARMLNAFGRWSEALVELYSFKKIQSDTPYEIDADFYRAEALHAAGNREEARNIWENIVSTNTRATNSPPPARRGWPSHEGRADQTQAMHIAHENAFSISRLFCSHSSR